MSLPLAISRLHFGTLSNRVHQEPQTEKPPRHQAAVNSEILASELPVPRIERFIRSRHRGISWTRLPEPTLIGSLLMLTGL